MKIGDKVKVNKDIPSIDGMLREGTVVKIDQIYDLHKSAISNNNLRVMQETSLEYNGVFCLKVS